MVVMGQELQDMLEKHKAQNEAWLRARADENDKERKELCKLRVCDLLVTTNTHSLQTSDGGTPNTTCFKLTTNSLFLICLVV